MVHLGTRIAFVVGVQVVRARPGIETPQEEAPLLAVVPHEAVAHRRSIRPPAPVHALILRPEISHVNIAVVERASDVRVIHTRMDPALSGVRTVLLLANVRSEEAADRTRPGLGREQGLELALPADIFGVGHVRLVDVVAR